MKVLIASVLLLIAASAKVPPIPLKDKAFAPEDWLIFKLARNNPTKKACFNWYTIGYFCTTYEGQIKEYDYFDSSKIKLQEKE